MKTGNVKQVATFEELLGFCHAHGAMYNPSKASIKIAALEELFTSAQQSLEAVKIAYTEYNNAVNVRQAAFNSLPVFCTRLVNALAATDASKATLEEAYAYVKKFRWNIPQPPPATEEKGEAIRPARTRSTSETDYASRTESFAGLVKVVSQEPTFHPNEADISIEALNARIQELRNLNTNVIGMRVALSNARASRNKILFEQIYASAKAVKRYVKGTFGYRSVAYNQIKGLTFISKKIS